MGLNRQRKGGAPSVVAVSKETEGGPPADKERGKDGAPGELLGRS